MIYETKEPKVKFQKFSQEEYLYADHPGFSTKAIHYGQDPQPVHGSVNVPIHMTSTYAQKDIGQPFGKFDYTRGGNPTREALETLIAGIQYGKYAITYSSGCGATTTIFHTLKSGDHVIMCDDVYGGTNRYVRVYAMEKFGIQVEFVDMTSV